MPKAKKLPKTIFVKREDDGAGGTFLLAHELQRDQASMEEVVQIGVYELVENRTLEVIIKEERSSA